jgi:hypothetical protein
MEAVGSLRVMLEVASLRVRRPGFDTGFLLRWLTGPVVVEGVQQLLAAEGRATTPDEVRRAAETFVRDSLFVADLPRALPFDGVTLSCGVAVVDAGTSWRCPTPFAETLPAAVRAVHEFANFARRELTSLAQPAPSTSTGGSAVGPDPDPVAEALGRVVYRNEAFRWGVRQGTTLERYLFGRRIEVPSTRLACAALQRWDGKLPLPF